MSQDIFIAIQPITGNDVYITPDASTIEEVNVNVQPFSGEEVYINVQPDTGSQLNINMSSSMAGVLLLNGRDGIVTIDKNDVGLSNVENVSITGASGYLQYQIDNLDLNYASQTEINSLSGAAVLLYGNQNITGFKNFNSLGLSDNLFFYSQASGRITGSGITGNYDGGYFLGRTKIIQNNNRLTNIGVNWVARESNREWTNVAISSNGQYQSAVVNNGRIYISNNYGVTWTPRDANRSWAFISISADGKHQTALVAGGALYISKDYGNAWTPKFNGVLWGGVALSSDGKYQTAVAFNSNIFTSNDYGDTWNTYSLPKSWQGVALSSDGKYQTAVVQGEKIYTSNDYGNTWLSKESNRDWQSISISSDGQYQTATVLGGQIYTSNNYGNTWIAREGNRNWESVSISSDGQYQTAVVNNGRIFVSTDYGNTWISRDSTNRQWRGVSISSDGKYQVGVVQNGQIYISIANEIIDGDFTAQNIYGNNLVYNSGAQTISGAKNFVTRPTVNNSGVLLIGEAYPSNNPSGFITGVDLSSYATNNNLASTGSNLQNQINSFSGDFINFTGNLNNTYATDTELFGASGALRSTINILSGNSVLLYGNQNITGVKNFVTKPTVNGSGFVLYGEDRYYQINNLSNIIYQDPTYNVNFDGAGELKGAYASGDVVLNGKTWSIVEGLIGLEAGEILSPPRSLRLRGYGTSQFLLQNPLDYGLYSISFDYRRYSADTQVSWNVEYDVNQNNTWNNIGNFTAGATTQTFNAIIDVTGKIRVRVVTTAGGTSNRRVNLDNFVFIAASNTVTNPAPGSKFLADTRSGSFVFPLPSNPASGFYYIFTDPFYNWGANNLILSGASVIENDGNLFTGDINGAEMKAIFINQNSGWRII